MPRLSYSEYSLLDRLQDIINNDKDQNYHGDYMTIVHQIYDILQRKYKFSLKNHYIGYDGEILRRND